MKRKFTFLIAAAVMLLTMVATTSEMWGQTTIWSENFNGLSENDTPTAPTNQSYTGITYTCTNGTGTSAGTTKIMNANLATGASAPELMVGKKGTSNNAQGGKFTVVVPLDNYEGTLTLTYYQNKNGLSVTSTTTGVSGGQTISPSSAGQQTTTFTGITTEMTSITIVFEATTTSNVRLDDIVLTGTQATQYTITAQSNNTNYGTVSLSGTVITGAPNPGYRYANPSYSVDPANSATVVQDGNTFTVTPSANTTITINFEAIPCYTVTLGDDSSTLTEVSAGAGVTLPSRNAIGAYSFTGWSPTNVTPETTTAPETIIPAGTYYPTENITLYPVYTKTEGGGGSTNNTVNVSIADYAAANNWTNGNAYQPLVMDSNISIGGTISGNNFKYYSSDNSWRFYTGGSFTITANNDATLTSVTLTFSGGLSYNSNEITSATAFDVTGSSATISCTSNAKITAISVSYTIPESGTTYYWSSPVLPTVATPVITPAENPFLFSTTATITCETEGAVIKYRYNENDDWTNYTTSLTITETKTIYAKAVLNENESSVAQVTVTKNLAVPTVTVNGDLIVDLDGETNVNAGTLTATVTYNEVAVDGATVTWSSNNTDVAVIGETTGVVTIKAVGNVTFTATYAGNSDYAEATGTKSITVIDSQAPGTEGNPYTVAQAIDYINTLGNSTSTNDVYVSGIISQVDSYNSTYKSITYWISDDGTTTTQMEVYSGKGLNGADFSAKSDLAVGEIVTVKGKVKKYSGTPEFIQNNQLVFHQVATPTLSPAAGAVALNTTVTISCATTGSTIYYTTNGVDPTTESDVYSAPITIDAAKTIKAFAVKDGMNNSNIATGAYILEPAITVEPSTINQNAGSGEGVLTVTYANITDIVAAVYFCNSTGTESAEYDWIDADIDNDNNVYYMINANTSNARTAYFKVSAFDDEMNIVYSNLVTVNQDEYVAPENKYVRFTGALVEGDYLIVYDDAAMNTTVDSDRLQYADVTINNNVIANDDDDAIIWHIAPSGNYWTIYNADVNKYAASTGAKNKAQLLADGTDDKALWTITGTDTYDFVNKKNTEAGVNAYLRKNGTYGFACYASGTGGALSLYKKNCVLPVTNDELTASYTIPDGDASVYDNLTIPAGESYVLTVSGTLEITGTFTNTVAEHLIIEDGGQLIYNGSVQATMKKSTAHSAKTAADWYTIASPLNETVTTTSSNTNLTTGLDTDEYDLYRYNETNMKWENSKAGANSTNFTNIEAGRGYLYWREDGADLVFAGELRNNDVNYSLTAGAENDDLKGFNLIGNPFSQNITMSNISGAALTGGYVLTQAGAWGASVETTISPCQGFLVQVDAAKNITISKTAAKSRANHDYIALTVANSQYEDIAYALFEDALGLNKINHRNADIPMLYIPQDGENYAIATMKDDTKMFGLNFKAMTTGQYTLSYKAEGNYDYLHVIDRLTGEDIDMLLDGEYSFIASPSDNDARFIVKLGYNANSNADNDIFAYQNGNDIIVNGEGELQVFDVTGRMVATQHVNGVQTVNVNAHGVYIFKLNEKTQKFVVR